MIGKIRLIVVVSNNDMVQYKKYTWIVDWENAFERISWHVAEYNLEKSDRLCCIIWGLIGLTHAPEGSQLRQDELLF